MVALLSPILEIEFKEALKPYETFSVPYLVKLIVFMAEDGAFQFSTALKYSLNNPPVALSDELVPTGWKSIALIPSPSCHLLFLEILIILK